MHFHTIQNKTAQIIQWVPTVLLYLRTNIILTIHITKLAPISLQCNKTGIGWLTLFSGNRTQVKYPSMSQKWPKIKPFHFFNSFLTSVSNKQLFICMCTLKNRLHKNYQKEKKITNICILWTSLFENFLKQGQTDFIPEIFLNFSKPSCHIYFPCYSNIYSSIHLNIYFS